MKNQTPLAPTETDNRLGSTASLGSVEFIDRVTGAIARVETASDWFVTWTSGGFRFRTRRDIFLERYVPMPNTTMSDTAPKEKL